MYRNLIFTSVFLFIGHCCIWHVKQCFCTEGPWHVAFELKFYPDPMLLEQEITRWWILHFLLWRSYKFQIQWCDLISLFITVHV